MDGAMQDLSALGPRLQLDLLRDWPKLALDRDLWRGVASRCPGECLHSFMQTPAYLVLLLVLALSFF